MICLLKTVLVIGDGIADRPIAELGGKTPLQYSTMPALDGLCASGEVGLCRTIPDGIAPGSDTAFLSIFGYDPRVVYRGRAPLEAAGMGIVPGADEVTFRCNIVSLENGIMRSHNGGQIGGEDAALLMRALLDDGEFAGMLKEVRMKIHVSESFRHLAVMSGCSEGEVQTTPPHDFIDLPIKGHEPHGQAAPELMAIMDRAHAIMDRHPVNDARRAQKKLPANGIWFWGAGRATILPSFESMYGRRGAVITAVPLVRGIARLAGLDTPIVEGANGELDTNYKGKVEAALAAIDKFSFAALHIEAPDELSHAGDLQGKLRAISYIDEKVLSPLKHALDQAGEYRLLFMSDHATPVSLKTHTEEPVPYCLYDSRRALGNAEHFDELVAEKGPMVEGVSILARLFSE